MYEALPEPKPSAAESASDETGAPRPSMDSDAAVAHGLEVIERLYGPAVRDGAAAKLPHPQTRETLAHLMGEIWTRPQLSIRDRRLLALGVTATLDNPGLITAMVTGAILNEELSAEQLDEISLFLGFYVGWGKVGSIMSGIAAGREAAAKARTARSGVKDDKQ
jgi:alkylhydroperoxidase/carboxymuconolactone decarboxylase family protein YurZ